jgi:hypothetical protein
MENLWPVIIQLSVVLAGLAAGGTFVVPAIKRLKVLFKTSGWKTNVLVGAFAVLITLAVAVVEGTLSPGTINPESWGMLVIAIVGQAEIRYRQIQDDLEDE